MCYPAFRSTIFGEQGGLPKKFLRKMIFKGLPQGGFGKKGVYLWDSLCPVFFGFRHFFFGEKTLLGSHCPLPWEFGELGFKKQGILLEF